MKKDRELYALWKKYVNKNIYRVISGEYLKDVRKNGFNPKKDPYSVATKNKIKKFFKIILRLEKKGVVYNEKIGRNNDIVIKGKFIVERANISMGSNFIDLTQDYSQALKFKRKWRGGALTQAVYNFCLFLKNREKYLTDSEKKLLEEIRDWAERKRKFPNYLLFINGSSKCLESAKFLHQKIISKNQKYWKSPYGSFEHFKNVARRTNIKKYIPHLKGEKYFYLRVTSKIPPSAISKIR